MGNLYRVDQVIPREGEPDRVIAGSDILHDFGFASRIAERKNEIIKETLPERLQNTYFRVTDVTRRWIRVRDSRERSLIDRKEAYKAKFWQKRAQGWLVLEGEFRSARVRPSKRGGWLVSYRHNYGCWNSGNKVETRKQAKLDAISWVYSRVAPTLY